MKALINGPSVLVNHMQGQRLYRMRYLVNGKTDTETAF